MSKLTPLNSVNDGPKQRVLIESNDAIKRSQMMVLKPGYSGSQITL